MIFSLFQSGLNDVVLKTAVVMQQNNLGANENNFLPKHFAYGMREFNQTKKIYILKIPSFCKQDHILENYRTQMVMNL